MRTETYSILCPGSRRVFDARGGMVACPEQGAEIAHLQKCEEEHELQV